MRNIVDSFLFLGLPKSGKTTYFSLMSHYLQDVANRTSHMKFLYLPSNIKREGENSERLEDITSNFIDDCISRIKKQRWPVKTQTYEFGYSFELDIDTFPLFGVPILRKKGIIIYHDYPGEAFEAAFCIDSTANDQCREAAPEMIAIAETMKDKIKCAKGLFLILDADAMFNGQETKIRKKALTGLLRYINKNHPDVKLALIFNKLELFYGNTPNFVMMLQRRYSNVYAHLTLIRNRKFFEVYPLGEVETDEDGAIRPPKTLKPRNILDPVRWMIHF